MNAKEEFINSKEPATKGDIEQLREDLQVDMAQMEERIGTKLEAILTVVEDTNARITARDKEFEDIPKRVHILEDDVLQLKAKAR